MSTNDLRSLPPQDRLRELFDYDSESGVLLRKRRSPQPNRWDSRWAGKPAGRKGANHSRVLVDGEMFLIHRVIWKWVTGEDPPKDIDHRDLDPSNNRWGNLRLGGKTRNSQNRGLQRNNKSGHKGVCWIESRKRWLASIKIDGKQRYLGRHKTFEEACDAYRKVALEVHGEFAHPSIIEALI